MSCLHFFAPDTAAGHKLGQFVTQPFRSWGNKTQKMNGHSKLDYHLTAMTKMSEFLARYKNPSQTISTIFDQAAKDRLVENKQVVESLLEVVLLCGSKGLRFVAIATIMFVGQNTKKEIRGISKSLCGLEMKSMRYCTNICKKHQEMLFIHPKPSKTR